MQRMIDLLQEQAFEKDTEVLEKFYQSVRTNVGGIDNLEGKQTIIKNLYEKFFKGAFRSPWRSWASSIRLWSAWTSSSHSVNDILKAEFDTSLTEQNVHILGPVCGYWHVHHTPVTVRPYPPEDMERKVPE